MRNTILLFESLKNGDLESASIFIGDKLHQPYRKDVYGISLKLVEILIEKYKIPAAISGAGPSVIAIADDKTIDRLKKFVEIIEEIAPGYKYIETSICHKGSNIL